MMTQQDPNTVSPTGARPDEALSKPAEIDPVAESSLVVQAQRGDRDAFRQLVEKYQKRVFRLVFGLLRSAEDAEDVTQEVFVKAYFSLKNFQGKSSFYTWLYRIAYNMTIDFRRSQASRAASVTVEYDVNREHEDNVESGLAGAVQDVGPQETLLRKEKVRYISRAIDQLSDEHKAVVILREVDGLSYEEISRTVGVSLGTVMSRLHYARRKLQQSLKDYAPKKS